MTPILPYNSFTITSREWPTDTVSQIQERLTHLRSLDSHERTTSNQREMEKAQLEEKLKRLRNGD